MQNYSISKACLQSHPLNVMEIIPYQKLALSLTLGFINTMWFLNQSLHPKVTTQQFLMGPCRRRKSGLWGGGDGEVFYFPCFLQECSLVSAAWRRPERASPVQPFIWHTKAISQEDELSLPYSSSALLVVSSSLSYTHSHTHTLRLSLACQWNVQENMNVNQWETHGEKEKQALTPREKAWEWQRTSLSVTFWWLTSSKRFVNSAGPKPLGNTARPKGPNPSNWWMQEKSHWKKGDAAFQAAWKVLLSLFTLSWVSHS